MKEAAWLPTPLAMLLAAYLIYAFNQNPELALGPSELSTAAVFFLFPLPFTLCVYVLGMVFFPTLAAIQYPLYIILLNYLFVKGLPHSWPMRLLLFPALLHIGWLVVVLILAPITYLLSLL